MSRALLKNPPRVMALLHFALKTGLLVFLKIVQFSCRIADLGQQQRGGQEHQQRPQPQHQGNQEQQHRNHQQQQSENQGQQDLGQTKQQGQEQPRNNQEKGQYPADGQHPRSDQEEQQQQQQADWTKARHRIANFWLASLRRFLAQLLGRSTVYTN